MFLRRSRKGHGARRLRLSAGIRQALEKAMKKISSAMMVFHKKIFPLAWFGFLAFFVLTAAAAGAFQEGHWLFLAAPLFMAVFGFIFMKKLIWNLVDEVFDCGDYLLVRKGGEEENVSLGNIMNVSASAMTSPPRITLRLLNPGKFGAEISFSPPARFSLNPFARNPVADDLIVRVDRARRGHA
jgi:hypothetical protein